MAKIYRAADLESKSTGKANQCETEAWSVASIELDAPDEEEYVYVDHSLSEYFTRLFSYNSNVRDYFHNIKFDGSFIIDWLLKNGYKLSVKTLTKEEGEAEGYILEEDDKTITVLNSKTKDMEDNSFTTLISSKGIFYSIKIKKGKHTYEMYDSLKLLPMSLKKLAKDFDTKHKKLEMEYEDTEEHEHYAGCEITDVEMKYIKNDVLCLKEALNIMFSEGHDKMTIASCAMSDFKEGYNRLKFDDLFPNLYTEEFSINEKDYGAPTAGDYIRKSFRGGITQCMYDKTAVFEKETIGDRVYQYKTPLVLEGFGSTFDANSLYPSQMIKHDYPVGIPHFWKGDIPKKVLKNDKVIYFVRVKTRFYLKENKIPCIQLKPCKEIPSLIYPPREWLKTSDVYNRKTDTYSREWFDDIHNRYEQAIPIITFTQADWELIQECYDLEDTEVLDGCWFYTKPGEEIFGEYIHKWAQIKMKNKGSKKAIAKLFSNSLFGRFAMSTDVSYKMPYLDENGVVHYKTIECKDVDRGAYIPIGSFIPSYGRCELVRYGNDNYETTRYMDTDSLHMMCRPDEVKNIPVDAVKYGFWKNETVFDKAVFVRPKTYIEHIIQEDGEDVEPYWNIKCAGMPERAKKNFLARLTKDALKPHPSKEEIREYEEYIGITNLSQAEIEFHQGARFTPEDFQEGLEVPGSLKPRVVRGGTVLINQMFKLRKGLWD